jgi:hypothetical protein
VIVAGGTYWEFCAEPHWNQLFGSGGRAAAALKELAGAVELWTYIGKDDRIELDLRAHTFGISAHTTTIPETVSFTYAHGLSVPTIRPSLHMLTSAQPFVVKGDVVLRFGLVEGDAVVHGGRVIYDPQSMSNPRPFGENGSRAGQLAILGNAQEIRMLAEVVSGTQRVTTIEDAAEAVRRASAAQVVVVKQASRGTVLVSAQGTTRLPAFRTERVWPIGSGDVFAAAFAYWWGMRDIPLDEAVRRASLSTAYYCDTQALPIPADESKLTFPPLRIPGPEEASGRVYLAGPFFTMAERWIVTEARKSLIEQGIQVFSPFHDVGHGLASDVVPADLKALDESALVFALLDGLDAGTLFEVGYARAKSIPVIALTQNETHEDLKMLAGTDCEFVTDLTSGVYRVAWRARCQ